MLRQIQTKGIILKKYKYDENDEIVSFYSAELGKISAVAKGSRKITSHFCGHLETLNICELELYKSPYRFTITQAATLKNFKNIRNDYNMTVNALTILEIFHKSTSSEETFEGEKIFSLLENTLDKIGETKISSLILESFKIRLMKNLGVLPDITVCSRCQKRWDTESTIYLNQDYQLLCRECLTEYKNCASNSIDFKTIKLINYLLEYPNATLKISIQKEEKRNLQLFTNIFLYHYINSEIHSEKIMEASII